MQNDFAEKLIKDISKCKAHLPILILDEIWLSRFPKNEKNEKILKIEVALKEKIKQEAKLIESNKKLKEVKNQFLKEIILLSEKLQKNQKDSAVIKKIESNRKNIIQINEELDKNEDTLTTVPREIQEINSQLMEETLKICYNLKTSLDKELYILDEKLDILTNQTNEIVEKRNTLKEKSDKVYRLLYSLIGRDSMNELDKITKN